MGFFAFFKFLIPLLIDGLKEILVPKSPHETARTSITIRICILVIVLLFLLLGFVTDKLYSVHTDKVSEAAQIYILQEHIDKCNKLLLDAKYTKVCPQPKEAPNKPTPKPNRNLAIERSQMIKEINYH